MSLTIEDCRFHWRSCCSSTNSNSLMSFCTTIPEARSSCYPSNTDFEAEAIPKYCWHCNRFWFRWNSKDFLICLSERLKFNCIVSSISAINRSWSYLLNVLPRSFLITRFKWYIKSVGTLDNILDLDKWIFIFESFELFFLTWLFQIEFFLQF